MDIVLGIKVKDAVIIATSKAATRGISIIGEKDDKTRKLSDHSLIAFTGEAGDTGMLVVPLHRRNLFLLGMLWLFTNALFTLVQFAEYIQANVQLYGIRENFELSPKAVASFTRNELAKSLRSRVSGLVANQLYSL